MISESDELASLRSAGVVWLSTAAQEHPRVDRWGNGFAHFRALVGFTRSVRFSYDVFPVTTTIDGTTLAFIRS